MRHSRLLQLLCSLLVAVVSSGGYLLFQVIPQSTHTVLNQTLQRFGMSDVSLVYLIVGLVIVLVVGILIIIIYIIIHDRQHWTTELTEHYSGLKREFDTVNFPRNLPINVRDSSIVNVPTLSGNAELHLQEEVRDASSIMESLRQWGSQVQAVASDVNQLVSRLGVDPADPNRINLTGVWNTYLGSQGSMQMIGNKLVIKQKQDNIAPIWGLYLDGSELGSGRKSEVEAKFKTIKNCMNDGQIENRLAELRNSHNSLQLKMNEVQAACTEISEAINQHNYYVKKRCCPSD